MTDDRSLDRSLERAARSWLEAGPTTAPDHAVAAALARIQTTSQERDLRIPWRTRDIPMFARLAAVATIGVVALGGAMLIATRPPSTIEGPTAPASTAPSLVPSPSASTAPSLVASPSLPARGLPGPRGGRPGLYGWQGTPGSTGGMHWVKEGRINEAAAMIFSVGPGCAYPIPTDGATPVQVAGFDGVYVEPFTPPVTFGAMTDPTTRAYALAVGDRTLCVYVTWGPETTAEERAASLAILDTIAAHPIFEDQIRIEFTLNDVWDSG